MKNTYPSELISLVTALHAQGIELYAVGGCVRDRLRGEAIRDIDLSGPATPEQMRSACKRAGVRCVPVNVRLGTLLLQWDGLSFEYTTFRTESYPAGGSHRPSSVAFTTSMEADAHRRDFTVNALYENVLTGEITDPTGGVSDLQQRILKTTSADPADILRDDGLRILRLIRFGVAMGFEIEPATWESAKAHVALLSEIAWERKRGELDRILLHERVYQALDLLHRVGALPYLLPELAECDGVQQRRDHHKYDVLHHCFHACECAPPILELRLAALLHDVGKPPCKKAEGNLYLHDVYGERISRRMLERLTYSREQTDRIAFLVRTHMFDLSDAASEEKLRKRFCMWGPEKVRELIAIREADVRGNGYQTKYTATRWRATLERMIEEQVPFCGVGLAVNGADIMRELGLPPGTAVGHIKRKLVLHVGLHPKDNTKERLLKRMHDYR